MNIINENPDNYLDESISMLYKSMSRLKELASDVNFNLPNSPMGIGFVAELYSHMYLRFVFDESMVSYAPATQRGWDIKVEDSGKTIRYQVKSTDGNFSSRKIKISNLDFDRLIILTLGDYFVPIQAFIIDDVGVLNGTKTLTLPSIDVPSRKGSSIFRCHSRSVLDEFLSALE